jgi:hypothetical protein
MSGFLEIEEGKGLSWARNDVGSLIGSRRQDSSFEERRDSAKGSTKGLAARNLKTSGRAVDLN